MITVDRTFDLDLVKRVMTHRRIYPHISDDGSPSPEEFHPIEHDQVIYLHARDDETLGVFMLHPHNTACFEVHTCMLPRAWGDKAKISANLGTEWMFRNTQCSRIMTNVPTYNRVALEFARACGMEEFGRNPKSFLKNGVLYDQHMLGLSKE